jgi:hypothetical protein
MIIEMRTYSTKPGKRREIPSGHCGRTEDSSLLTPI